MIQFNRLTYTYPGAQNPVLEDISLEIDDADFVLLTGPSGAGKSTLLRCLNGLVPHFTGGTLYGDISVAGHNPISEGPQVLSHVVGFVFQDPEAQFVVEQVEDEIAFALENAAIHPTEMRSRIEEVLDLLGLVPLRGRAVDTLSGGEKQKVAIAAAMALRPSVLVLDEPTSQLDPQSAQEVLQTLVSLNRDLGLTILLAEHRLERVLPYVDQMIYLRGRSRSGESEQSVLSGAPRKVLERVDLTPPIVTLGKKLGWSELPLTVKEGRHLASEILLRSGHDSSPRGDDISRGCARPCGNDAETVLNVRDLRFAYENKEVLKGVSLAVRKGELVALMGRNGSGKTTLLKCLTGLLRPRHGTIEMGGQSLKSRDTAEICRSIGYLPQQPDDLLFADTVSDELIVTLRNHDLMQAPPIEPDRLLKRLGLEAVVDAYPRDLSVGQRQRVALGAVTVTRPLLLLLDEPTRGMDYAAKEDLVRLLREWQSEGSSILLVTHDVELVALAADRVVVLSQGEIIADACPSEVLASSPLFAPQIARLFPGTGWLTVDDVLANLDTAIYS
ncbi:MAG: ATP-binding cassette domain-containing protein [Anaerolineae bacterium]|nr:ATP-binding cassette domain-containing protein [Anaerolineae bacterium]